MLSKKEVHRRLQGPGTVKASPQIYRFQIQPRGSAKASR
jgi:hypothetical protein